MKTKVTCFVLATLALVVIMAGVPLVAQEAARFADPERVAAFLDAQPRAAITLLEAMLSQEQLTALEHAMFPLPTDDEKRKVYEATLTWLRRTGLADDDVAVAELTRKLDALPPVVEPK